ncbi:MAG: hypothetical protein AAF191_08745, partial [Verrucomicrobiota bacterium]
MTDHLTPWTDPETEARIVALLYGELSDFERDQLEHTIQENPDLAAFQQRMLTVHGHLRDLHSAEAAPWKLDKDRRQTILHAIGAELNQPKQKASLLRTKWFLPLVGVGVATLITVLCLPASLHRSLPRTFSTNAEIASADRRMMDGMSTEDEVSRLSVDSASLPSPA